MTFEERKKMFESLCIEHGIPVPHITEVSVSDEYPCDYTDARRVCLNIEAAGDATGKFHTAHVFGHYLADLHTEEGRAVHGEAIFDLVADTVAVLVCEATG